MARTPLRTYLKEIEMMIERGQIDEAAAHCRHILDSFPKLVAAYRLMGKAFLEGKRYTDAADLFQRVLSTVPDDFVSHVGMSIIREDEGNQDAAIWHMERAFEVQPYNAAIQSELRRLYGRRDGVEPPKVRLTRGALARMYARGNLYQQAITELRAGLAEDQQRPDLQVLLARMFFLSGAKVEAVETCSQLLNKLPYCLEANRTLSAILPETGRKEDAQAYAQRVQSLDPYLAQASPAAPSGDGVPEASVILERMEYTRGVTGSPAPSQPAWAASLGVSVAPFTTKEEVLPDWLEELEKETEEDGEQEAGEQVLPEEEQPAEKAEAPINPEPAAMETPDWLAGMAEAEEAKPAEEPLPDWMQSAGWTSAPGTADQEQVELPDLTAEEVAPGDGEIAPAEIPDWLKALAPDGIEEASTEEEEAAAAEALMPWLQSSAPDALIGAKPEALEPVISEPETHIEQAIEIPDWLSEPGEAEEAAPAEAAAEEVQAAPAVEEIEQAQPVEEMEAAPIEPAPEWQAQPEQSEQVTEAVAQEAEIPDWLKDIETAPETGEEEAVVPLEAAAPEEAVLSDEDAAIAWLESLAAKQGVSEDELMTKPEERLETAPEWVSAVEPETAAAVEAEPTQETAPEELPEWTPMQTAGEPEQVEEAIQEEEAPAVPVELPEWLPEENAPAEEVEAFAGEAVEAEPGELPDWLRALDEETSKEETSAVEEAIPAPVEPETTAETAAEPEAALPFEAADETAALAWLESLAAKQGVSEEELITKPEERLETPPEWISEAAAVEAAPEEEAAQAEERPVEVAIPEWLEEMSVEATEQQGEEIPVEVVPEAPAPVEMQAETPVGTILQEEPVEEAAPVLEAIVSEGAAPVEEPLPDWLETLAKEEAVLEQPAEPEAAPVPEQEVELPEWMKETEEAEKDELPWKPEPLVTLAEPVRLLDINQASLVELEALPGVGFRMAQSILNYRQEHGSFTSLDDLLAVPNFSSDRLQELAGQLTVTKAEPPSPLQVEEELRTVDADQELLIRARNALMQEQIETMTGYYSQLIKQESLLDEVIHDLHEALYRFPVEVSIWETLGDAYARCDQLQEALDAYTKAEELLR